MIYFKKGVTYRWLHKGDESVCLDVESEEYAEKKSGGWSNKRGEQPEEIISEDMPDPLDELSDEEVRELAKANNIPNHWNMKIERLKDKIREIL